MNKQELIKRLENNQTLVATVNSTNLATWAYTPESKVLTILFNKTNIYQYENVGKDVILELINAESAGKCFHKHIRGKYQFSRLNPDGSIAYIGA